MFSQLYYKVRASLVSVKFVSANEFEICICIETDQEKIINHYRLYNSSMFLVQPPQIKL